MCGWVCCPNIWESSEMCIVLRWLNYFKYEDVFWWFVQGHKFHHYVKCSTCWKSCEILLLLIHLSLALSHSTIILIFPAIDVLSAYPLISITLGENLLGVVGKGLKLDLSNRGVVVIFRVLASTPPLIVRFINKIVWLYQQSSSFHHWILFFLNF